MNKPLFQPEALQFLFEIKLNNSKTWYTENKDAYTELLYQPFQKIVTSLSETMFSIDKNFETRPQTDKTISRIYRDCLWLTFKKIKEDWQDTMSLNQDHPSLNQDHSFNHAAVGGTNN